MVKNARRAGTFLATNELSELHDTSEVKLCVMEQVSGGDIDCNVDLVRSDGDRLVIRGYNEAGYSCVDIDLIDLLEWLNREAKGSVNVKSINSSIRTRFNIR
ncbi:MAG: hypothetical protein FD175_170 [Beijerinckiaceae bacterium]|nr:MAG: hypothetical protein FD175_170 [Beijerinckiaceae bacterium]